jgi:GntR family transcriptional regulator
MRRRGLNPSTRSLGVELDLPPADVASALGLAPGQQAWWIERVRLADGQPIALEQGWYPEPLLPDLNREDLGGSLYEVFAERYGLVIDKAEQTLWAESADSPTAHRLDAPLHTALLVFRRTSSADGRPLEHVVSRYRADRYQLHMSLGRDDLGPIDGDGTSSTARPTERKKK